MDSSQLDAVDYAILYHLQEDGRQAVTNIADELQVADNTVHNRLQDLEEKGIIEGYQANVNYDQAGIQHHYMFVCTARVSQRESLAREARAFPDVTEVITLMTGKNNVYIIGSATKKDEISNLAYNIDDLGLSIEQEHLIRNHVRQPFGRFQLEEDL